jgi:hypothetical protein
MNTAFRLVFAGSALFLTALAACDGHDVTLGNEGNNKGSPEQGGTSPEAGPPPAPIHVPTAPPDDAGACIIQASAYDQSCTQDSDCVAVPVGGNTCDPCHAGSGDFACKLAGVNASHLPASYETDLSAALAKYEGTATWTQCVQASCPVLIGPRCSAGVCVVGPLVDAGPVIDGGPAEKVTFKLAPGAGVDGGGYSYGTTQDNAFPKDNWLTLFSSDGKTQYDLLPTESSPLLDCSTCSGGFSVPIGLAWGALGSGVSTQWDGTVYTPSTCGASSEACLQHAPLPAGTYDAKMCACSSDSLSGTSCSNPTCVDAPFTLPGATVVTATVP